MPHASYRSDYQVSWNSGDEDRPLDLLYNPLDYDWANAEARWFIPKYTDEAAARTAAESVKRWAVAASTRFFDSVTTLSDLPAAFEAKRAIKPTRWEWGEQRRLLPQEQLAYAFTLRHLGRVADGRPWLEAFITHDPQMPRAVRQQLRTLYDAPPLERF